MNVNIKKMPRKDVQMYLSNKCKDFRQQLSISVQNMANIINVSRQTIYDFENGKIDSMTILYYYLKMGCII